MARGIMFASALDHAFMGNPSTLEEWHKALYLPEEYKVVGFIRNRDGWNCAGMVFLVESESIPESPTGLTEIKPIYSRIFHLETGQSETTFERMEMEA